MTKPVAAFEVELRLGHVIRTLRPQNGTLIECIDLNPKIKTWCQQTIKGCWHITRSPFKKNDDQLMIVFTDHRDAEAFRSYWS